jgi:hypothetical protein
MCPDVALTFDRLGRAARVDGVALIINSAFRSDAEQAELWRQHPDPRRVAPPGTSLHRNGTELDLGPPAAYGWLRAHAERFHFVQRYSWEAWHQETPLALNERTPRRVPRAGSPTTSQSSRMREPGRRGKASR